MTISVGDRLPDAELSVMTPEGPALVRLQDKLTGRKVVLFALPGAFTGTCSEMHLPSFIRTAPALREKGVQDILCLSVNDPFALGAWDAATGAGAAGITLLGDADGSFTRAMGMAFDAPPIGLYGRSNRYALLVEDGVVTVAQIDTPGACELSTGESLLAAL